MLDLLSLLFPINNNILYTQNTETIEESYIVQPLPGQLNQIPVFNSNSPELVMGEGILLSTFTPENKKFPQAHLNYGFQGRFDIFTHHVAKAVNENDQRTLYLGIIVNNPSNKTVTIDLLQGGSYLSQPDAPFIELPAQVESSQTYAGPGSRVTGEVLQGKLQDIFPRQIKLEPNESKMLLNVPIPVQNLTPKLNGRSTYLRLYSDGLVHLASLAMYRNGEENPPSLVQWEKLLSDGQLSTPRDLAPTSPKTKGKFIYSRVAGVSQGNLWQSKIVDYSQSEILTIPKSGETLAYGISTLQRGTFGTNQIQTAPMIVRYPDTAYSAHGNYGVEYNLTLPLYNPTNQTQTVKLAISTPIKQDVIGVKYLSTPSKSVFFRGLVQIKYLDEQNIAREKYVHLVQKRGEKGEDLITVEIPPKGKKPVSINFLYPPDATPPQILTVTTK
jgi:hypothetical protein